MTANIKLTMDDLRYISLFENVTGARTQDCILDEEGGRVIFIVQNGNLGAAIGKNGKNIAQVKQLIGKEVEIIEYNTDPAIFIRNCLAPARIKAVQVSTRKDGQKVLAVIVNPKDRGLAIGKGGRNIARARLLLNRHFGIVNIIVE